MIINAETLAQFHALSALFTVKDTPSADVCICASPPNNEYTNKIYVTIEISGDLTIEAVNKALGSNYPEPKTADAEY